jgi:hypothetical protein
MGMHPMPRRDHCPGCAVSLVGKEIPLESRECFGGATHFRREIGVNIRGVYDGALYFQCPDCGIQWNRWDKTSPLRYLAEDHMTNQAEETRP